MTCWGTRSLTFFLSILFASLTFASTAIVRVPSTPAQEWSVQTYAGPAQVTVSPVRLSPTVTILILVDTVAAGTVDQVKTDLLDLYSQYRGRPIQISWLTSKGELTGPTPVSSRVRLKQLLDKAFTAQNSFGGEQEQIASAVATLDDLITAAPRLGASRSTLVLVGSLPKLDPATTTYASARFSKACNAQQLRTSLISSADNQQDWTPLFHSLGGEIVTSAKAISVPAVGSPEPLIQLDWTSLAPSAGFVVSRSTVAYGQEPPIVELADIVAADATAMPSVQQYLDAQKKIAEAQILLATESLSQEQANQIREAVSVALQLNPREPSALEVATSLYQRTKDYKDAVSTSALLLEVRPRDGSAYASYGHVLLLDSELDRAESALNRAADLGVANAEINEDFARLHIERKDDKGALPYLNKLLQQDAKRQDLWFLQAEVSERALDPALAEHSYEEGLALGGVHIGEAASLLRLYLAAKKTDRATEFAKAELASLPATPDDRIRFASVLDQLHQNTLALDAWRKVLDVDAVSERAHTRVAQILLDMGDASGAEQQATAGLSAAPKSAPLFLVKAESEEKQGRNYQSRLTLEEGAGLVADRALAAQLAITDEKFFGLAPAAYLRLAQLSTPSSPEQLSALERGFHLSMRDGDIERARNFATALDAAGQKNYRALLGGEQSLTSFATVPGGLGALAFTAHASKEEIPPDRFFLEYSRTLVNGGADKGKNQYLDGIRDYFDRLAALRALGNSNSGDVVITLSLADKAARRQTEKALNILGIRLKNSKGEVELAQGETKSQAIKQESAAALALDEVGIQEALQSGKPYKLVIHDEPASVYPSEQVWRSALDLKSNVPGGFAAELVRVPRMASLYVGLNSMDRGAAEELLKAFPLRELCEHESDLLFYFSSALALEGTHAAVPGGVKAEPIWTGLVGASPATPGAFFRALITRNDGRLLVYFSILAQLDRAHQSFFTANERRTSQFYDLLTSTPQMKVRPFGQFRESGLQRMLRSVPLDENGHIDFPGSPEVWTVAKGRSSAEAGTAKLLKKVRKAAAPDLEDSVLARMAGTQYKENNVRISELDNFLAVSSVDAHRMEPMDEESALLLAQSYANFAPLYPYLTDLRTLTATDYRQIFAAFEHTSTHSTLDANLQLGQLHALTEWICLLVQRHAIQDVQATELIRKMTASFVAAEDASSYTSAALEGARTILQVCKGSFSSPDEALESCLLGRQLAANDERSKQYARVLEAQRVPRLKTLFAIYDASGSLPTAKTPQQVADEIQKQIDNLPVAELTKDVIVSGEEKNAILRYDPASARKIALQMKEKTAKRKINPKDLEKLSRELQAELQPQVVAALSGPLYADFLRSSDSAVMNDPLLLRKHQYFPFSRSDLQHERVVQSDFNVTSEKGGSYFVGGFAQFPYSAGLAAAHSKNMGGSIENVAAQLATIRMADWDRVTEADQRLASLCIIVAREWIYESARNPDLFRALGEETLGLLSLSRRADLLNGISSRDWRQVWASIALPELFSLGERYVKNHPTDLWTSQATLALRDAQRTDRDPHLNALGAIPTHIFGCNHPHLLTDAPYEEYEHHLSVEMGERAAEFKLFLVFQADHLAIEPAVLENAGEPLAIKAFRKAQMTDYRDWRSLLNAYASVSPADVQEAIHHE